MLNDRETEGLGFEALINEPGLIWACCPGGDTMRMAHAFGAIQHDGFRWLHLNLADQRTHRWLERAGVFPPEVNELLLAREHHPSAIVDGDAIGFVFQDFERGFDSETTELGSLHIALSPQLMITGRYHPVQSADVTRRRLDRVPALLDQAGALSLLLDSASGTFSTMSRQLHTEVQAADDLFHNGEATLAAAEVRGVRRRAARLGRVTGGLSAILHRLEEEPELPEDICAIVSRFAQRMDGINADIAATQSQIRALREEFDLLATQRTNSNLYFLSVMSALLLPATLVTGFFGMNTGGLPFAQGPMGTVDAATIAVASSIATWLLLRARR